MTDFHIDDHILAREADSLAQEIFDEIMADADTDDTPDSMRDTMLDRAHETADGHQWVIYTHKAILLCAHCDVSQGEEMLEDMGGFPAGETFGGMATKIAYGELHARIVAALDQIIDNASIEDDE